MAFACEYGADSIAPSIIFAGLCARQGVDSGSMLGKRPLQGNHDDSLSDRVGRKLQEVSDRLDVSTENRDRGLSEGCGRRRKIVDLRKIGQAPQALTPSRPRAADTRAARATRAVVTISLVALRVLGRPGMARQSPGASAGRKLAYADHWSASPCANRPQILAVRPGSGSAGTSDVAPGAVQF